VEKMHRKQAIPDGALLAQKNVIFWLVQGAALKICYWPI